MAARFQSSPGRCDKRIRQCSKSRCKSEANCNGCKFHTPTPGWWLHPLLVVLAPTVGGVCQRKVFVDWGAARGVASVIGYYIAGRNGLSGQKVRLGQVWSVLLPAAIVLQKHSLAQFSGGDEGGKGLRCIMVTFMRMPAGTKALICNAAPNHGAAHVSALARESFVRQEH